MQKVCELCSKPFKCRSRKQRFCCKRCANTNNSRIRKRVIGIACPVCGKVRYWGGDEARCLKCRPPGTKRRSTRGIKHRSKLRKWTEEEVNFLVEHYPDMGAELISQCIPKTRQQVQNKANSMRLRLTDKARARIVHSAAAAYMKAHNPSRLPGASERLRERCKKRPDLLEKLMEGNRRIQRDHPTKLEQKLFQILNSFHIKYEPYFLIKPKFIVDVKIGSLIIQADGDWWHGHSHFEPLNPRQLAQQARDKAQDTYLHTIGYTVIRVWESDLSESLIRTILEQYNFIQPI